MDLKRLLSVKLVSVKMTSITFYGGINEVGGNKILLEDKGKSVFLDFGKNFHKSNKYLPPLSMSLGIDDYKNLGMIPQISGIYLNDKEESTVNRVLISHSHQDHFGYIPFLKPEISAQCSKSTHAALKAYEDMAQPSLENQITYHKEKSSKSIYMPLGNFHIDSEGKKYKVNLEKHPERLPTHKGEILYREIIPSIERDFIIGNKSIDGMEVEFLPVDHSAFDAHGMIIHTSEGDIAYTGDIRFHGPDSEKSFEFIKKVPKGVEVLITEGTRIERTNTPTEEDVKLESTKLVKETKGLVFVDFPPRDLNRLNIFKNYVAEETDRTFVTPPKSGLYWTFCKLRDIIDEKDNRILSNFKVFSKDNETTTKSKRSISKYRFIEEINDEEIKTHPGRYIVQLGNYDLPKIIDFSPQQGSIFIKSIAEPTDEEGEVSSGKVMDAILKNWCDHFNLPIISIHSSGHMCGPDLDRMIKEINPKIILPIHSTSENSMLMKEKYPDKVKILEEGQKFEMKNNSVKISDYM